MERLTLDDDGLLSLVVDPGDGFDQQEVRLGHIEHDPEVPRHLEAERAALLDEWRDRQWDEKAEVLGDYERGLIE